MSKSKRAQSIKARSASENPVQGRHSHERCSSPDAIVSAAEISDVTMVLDEGSVKELSAAPPPSWDRVPVTEANRQGIVDP